MSGDKCSKLVLLITVLFVAIFLVSCGTPAEEKSDDKGSVSKLRNKLKKLKMKELRKIGYEYDAKDTKKSELIEEIINAKINRGEI